MWFVLEYKKHLMAIFRVIILECVFIIGIFAVMNLLFKLFVFQEYQDYNFLSDKEYDIVVESDDFDLKYKKYKKISNVITVENEDGSIINANVYIDYGTGFLPLPRLGENEIVISKKIADEIGVTKGDIVSLEFPLFVTPIEYYVKDIFSYVSDFYDVGRSKYISTAIIGSNHIITDKLLGKMVYFLSQDEYSSFMGDQEAYTKKFDLDNERETIKGKLIVLHCVLISIFFICCLIGYLFAHKELMKENIKYYHDGFVAKTVRRINSLDHSLGMLIPLVFETFWMINDDKGVSVSICATLSIILIQFGLTITFILIGGKKFGKAVGNK